MRVVQAVTERAKPTVGTIRAPIPQSAGVPADATGWREKGANGSVGPFSPPTERSVTRGKRRKEGVAVARGPAFVGTWVSDFYAADPHSPGVPPRCWAHRLGDIHALRALYPTDQGLADWAAVGRALSREGSDDVGADEAARRARQHELAERLSAPGAVQAKLCRRIQRHLPELFVFVGDPTVPTTTNAAERSLRHRVTSRTIRSSNPLSREP